MKLPNIAGWASGLNWYKWGGILVALLAYGTVMYVIGGSRAKVECEKDKTELAETRTENIIDFTNVQSNASTVAGKRSQEIYTAVAEAKSVLDRETAEKAELNECRLSVKRQQALNKIAEQTRRR